MYFAVAASNCFSRGRLCPTWTRGYTVYKGDKPLKYKLYQISQLHLMVRPSMVNRIISLHAEAIYEYRRLEWLGWSFVGGWEG